MGTGAPAEGRERELVVHQRQRLERPPLPHERDVVRNTDVGRAGALARSHRFAWAAPRVDMRHPPDRARLDHQEAVAEGDPGPDVEDEAEAQRKEGRPEETVGDPAGVKMPESRVDERQGSRRFPDPLPPDLPQETVALVEPAGAFPAPLLLARAQDLAEHAILVAGSEKVFRAEEIHGSAILWPRAREKQWSEGNNHELPPRNL